MTDNVRHPAPVNQFYRLEQDQPGGPWVKTTPWNNVVRVDGQNHDFDSENCMAAEGAVALDAHTNGMVRTSPAGIRNYQDDFSGGIGVDDVAVAWKRHFGDTLLTPDSFNRADVIAAVKARRHVAVGVDYRYVPDAFKRQIPGNFDHALGIDDIRADGEILVYDSLSTRPHWQPQSSVFPAAEALAVRARGTTQRLFVGLTGSRPRLSISKYRIVLPTYAFWVYTVRNGVITGRSSETRGGGDTVPCSVPPTVSTPWPGHTSRRVVRITKGIYLGRYMASNYAEAF